MAFTSFETGHRVSEQGYTHSLKEGWGSTQSYYALNSLRNLAQISLDNDVSNFSEAMNSLMTKGSYQDSPVQRTSYIHWRSSSQNLSGYDGVSNLKNLKVSAENFTLRTSSRFVFETEHFKESFGLQREIDIENVRDPLLDSLGLPYTIEQCRFENLALKLYTGDNYRGEARGKPLLRPTQQELREVPNPSEMIVFTEEVRKYDTEATSEFAGYVTLKEPPEPSSYNDNFVTDAPYIPFFENDQRAIIFEGLRKSNFRRMIEEDCYLSTTINDTPSVIDRVEGDSTGSSASGVFTLVDTDIVGQNPEKSNIGFQRVNGSWNLEEVHGVTSGDGIVWSDFRLGEKFAKIKGMKELSQE